MEFSYTTTTSERDWQDWAHRNVTVTNGGISLSQTTGVRERTIDEAVRDIAVDETGLLYTLSRTGVLQQYNPKSDSHRDIQTVPTNRSAEPTAIAVGASHIFVADDRGLTEVSQRWKPRQMEFGVDLFQPRQVTYDSGGLYAIDATGLVAIGTDLDPFDDPVDFAVSDDDVYVLVDRDDQRHIQTQNSEFRRPFLGPESFTVADERFVPDAIVAPGGDVIVAGTCAESGDHGVFEWDPTLGEFTELTQIDGRCHTLVGHARGDGMRTLYAVVGETYSCRMLSERIQNVTHPKRNKYLGFAITQFDSGVRGLEWHRLTFELTGSTVNTQVRVFYNASEQPALQAGSTEADGGLEARTGQGSEKTLFEETFSERARDSLRSIGIDTVRSLAKADTEALAGQNPAVALDELEGWQREAFDALEGHIKQHWTVVTEPETRDILLRTATGRYLNVAFELIGTPTASPHVDTVTVYCPRKSYLRYMPELYRQDEQSAAFLERFLSVFETSFTDIQSEIEGITQYFDPAGAPTDSLDWLEGWLAADEYRDWPESARREYLSRAPELYKMRGTRAGLREIIELYLRHATDLDSEPPGSADTVTGHWLVIIDNTDFDSIDAETNENAYETLLSNDRSLVVLSGPFESDTHRSALETIIDTEKPAHVDASLHVLDEEFVLGNCSFLGINTELDTESFSLGDATLGSDTYLSSSDPVTNS